MAVLVFAMLFVVGGALESVTFGRTAIEARASPPGSSRAIADPAPVGLFVPTLGPLSSVDSGSKVFYVGAQAPTQVCNPTCTYLTNSGAQTTIQVVVQSVTGCLSYWVGDDSAANIWGQVGYYICSGSTPVAFYQIWNLSAGTVLTTGTTNVTAGFHTFSMYSESGGDIWAYALDGTVFGAYDMGSSLSLGTYPVQAVSEEGLVNAPWNPAQVSFSTAMQTYQTASTNPVGSGWISVSTAFDPWGGCTSSGAENNSGGYTCWGEAGNLQDSSVPVDSLVTGGTTPLLRAGATLWSGTAPDFTLTASPTSVTINTGATGTSSVAVGSLNGFSGTVSLSASVNPGSGLTCGISPSSITGSGTATLSCTGSVGGTYTVTVTGASGSLSHATTVTFDVTGPIALTLSYAVVGSRSGYTAPTLTYVQSGSTTTATLTTAPAIFSVDPGSTWSVTNPLAGSSGSERWQSNQLMSGTATAAVTIVFTYYDQFAATFAYSVVGGGTGYSAPGVTYVAWGSSGSVTAGTQVWADAGTSYAFPLALPGSTSSESWMTATLTGTVAGSDTITAPYYHEYSVAFSYSVSGGGSGSGAPSVTYMALGSSLSILAQTTVWADAGTAFEYMPLLPGSSSTQRWTAPNFNGTVTASGSVAVAYIRQFWVNFTYTVKGGSGYSAPNVTYTNLSVTRNVLALGLWVWVDSGTPYRFQNPLPGSTSTTSWQTNSGSGTTRSSSTYSAAYRLQYKVKVKTTTVSGAFLPAPPLINVTIFGSVVSLSADNVTWVDAGGSYSFPGVFYGPLPGERWITATPPSGLVLGPMNITAAYGHQYFLAVQLNAPQGGTVSGTSAWYNATDAVVLDAAAGPGWQFEGWIGSGNGSYSGAASTAYVAMDAPVTETAVFYVGLTLQSSSGGSLQYAYLGTTGWVPAGTEETLYVAPGTNVTVRAAPLLFNELDGWGGSATGTSPSVDLVMNAPQSLSANFAVSLYSQPDSLLNLALVVTAVLVVALAVRRHRHKKKKLARRQALIRAQARIHRNPEARSELPR